MLTRAGEMGSRLESQDQLIFPIIQLLNVLCLHLYQHSRSCQALSLVLVQNLPSVSLPELEGRMLSLHQASGGDGKMPAL